MSLDLVFYAVFAFLFACWTVEGVMRAADAYFSGKMWRFRYESIIITIYMAFTIFDVVTCMQLVGLIK